MWAWKCCYKGRNLKFPFDEYSMKLDNRAFISYSIAQYTIYYEPINDILAISAPPSIISSGTIIYFVTLRYIVN